MLLRHLRQNFTKRNGVWDLGQQPFQSDAKFAQQMPKSSHALKVNMQSIQEAVTQSI